MCNKEIFSQYAPNKENLLAILHDIQNNNSDRYLTSEDIKEVADYMKLSVGVVYGVVSYYSMFSLTPRGKALIKVCDSPVCNMKGSSTLINDLTHEVRDNTGIELFTVEHCQCLGHCQSAPVFSINDKVYTKAEYDQIKSIANLLNTGKDVK